MTITRATGETLLHAAALACELWPGHAPDELLAEFEALSPEESAFFLAKEEGAFVGFAQCQLRRDYVEGTGSSPVGYLEGVYIQAVPGPGHGPRPAASLRGLGGGAGLRGICQRL